MAFLKSQGTESDFLGLPCSIPTRSAPSLVTHWFWQRMRKEPLAVSHVGLEDTVNAPQMTVTVIIRSSDR